MHVLLYIIFGFLAFAGFMVAFAGWGIAWVMKFMVLLITPAAPMDMPITFDNYDSNEIISREYERISNNKYKDNFFDVIEGKVNHNVVGDLALRSDGRKVYVINKEDDDRFSNAENINKLEVSGHDWALVGCKNNTKGCDVSMKVVYLFEYKEKGESIPPLPFDYKVYISKIKGK